MDYIIMQLQSTIICTCSDIRKATFQSADSKKQSKFRFANLSPAVLILNSFNLGLAKSLFDFES